MANKKAVYTFGGAKQDISKAKHTPQYYFEAQHIEILASDGASTGAAKNERGNTSVITIPTVTINEAQSRIEYGNNILSYSSGNEIASEIASGSLPSSSSTQIIIGHIETREGLVIWTTDGLGFDCIWSVPSILDGNYTLTLLYVRNFGFSTSSPIQGLFNYENENIQKVYWVDGIHQLRYLNITHNEIEGNTDLIDLPLNTINLVGNVLFSQPTIDSVVGGGSHTSGMIQYGYNLFRLNGSQTKLSPLSDLVALDKGTGLGGGELNETVSATPVISIDNIDESYTLIKVYAVKYTSLNEIPSIALIDERTITGPSITVYDDGTTIEDVTLEEFTFLGSNPIVPKHIESKYSRLFLANIQDKSFDVPAELDCRAYSFPVSSATTKVWKDIQVNSYGEPLLLQNFVNVPNDFSLDPKHPAINLEYDTRRYKKSSTVEGGTGKYIEYSLLQKTSVDLAGKEIELRFFKDNELYRIGIEFYNELGQTSPPKWIADFRAPEGNLEGNFNILQVGLTAEFYTWLNTYSFEDSTQIPVGYRILRANRTASDKTILCQGALTQMMVQTTTDVTSWRPWQDDITKRRDESNNRIKRPITLTRGFLSNIAPLNKTAHLEMMNELSDYGEGNGDEFPREEIYSGEREVYKRQQSWQYTKLMQLYSPEVLFNVNLAFSNNLLFRIKGLVQNTQNDLWFKRVQTATLESLLDEKYQDVNDFIADDDVRFLGLFGPSNTENDMDFSLFHRQYNTYIKNANSNLLYNVYGTPEITERGQGVVSYNGDPNLKYQNTMEGFLTDANDTESSDNDGIKNQAILSMNSHNARCLTLAEGVQAVDLVNRRGLEDIYNEASLASGDGLLLAEVVIPAGIVATGNIYGGNSYEDKSRTSYIKIGDFTVISTNTVTINNPGDTYVYNLRMARISKTDTEVLDDQVLQMTEIVEFPVESEVDLKNRNDKSLFEWDSDFQPSFETSFQYNRVYSQQPTLINNTSVDFTFKRVKNFDTRIQATKAKIPNESIDSWTDVLENEILDLDGKHGSINGFVTWKDTTFAFQDKAIATVSINPRIQVQADDGIGIELGTGAALYNFNYITTNSGTINKWSVMPGKKGVYYYDALNRAVGRVPNEANILLSDIKGMHSFFNNNYNYNLLEQDNPVLGAGIVFGKDNYNSDIYITALQGADSFTWRYNELVDEFVDLKTYTPSRYINNGERLIIPSSTNNVLWEQFSGATNNFFGTNQDSYITFQLNPEPMTPTTFDTVEFNSEATILNVDAPLVTYNYIHAWNDYQDTGEIALTVSRNDNIRRKFRLWKANIPREGRNRIKNPWTYLKLGLDNTTNHDIILHDLVLNYTV
jgi:hypothetical protein